MSIPYIPGWWDEISKNATGLVSQLPQMIQPDRVAQRRLQEMVQQNPMLMEQFSNMDDATRAQLAQSLGFRKENPLANLPIGAQRREREEIQGLRAEAMKDPTKAEELASARLGISNQQDRRAKELQIKGAELGLEGKVIDNKTGKIKLDVLEKEVARTEKILSASAPELSEAARAVVFGKPVPVESLQRIYADPNLAPAFSDYIKGYQMQMEANLRKTIASMRTPSDKMLAISWVEKKIDNLRMEADNRRTAIQGRNGMLLQLNDRPAYDKAIQELSEYENQLKEFESVYNEELKKQGIDLPKTPAPGPVTPGPLANPKNRMPLNQLDNFLFRPP